MSPAPAFVPSSNTNELIQHGHATALPVLCRHPYTPLSISLSVIVWTVGLSVCLSVSPPRLRRLNSRHFVAQRPPSFPSLPPSLRPLPPFFCRCRRRRRRHVCSETMSLPLSLPLLLWPISAPVRVYVLSSSSATERAMSVLFVYEYIHMSVCIPLLSVSACSFLLLTSPMFTLFGRVYERVETREASNETRPVM